MLLLQQFASQNIALFCCALYAGAATYVSLVEHPAVMAGGAGLADVDARTNVFAAGVLFTRLVRLHAALSLAGLASLFILIMST